ncbi:hypothetical protein RISK_000264 [Rhodopirellula islandica]|uniref:Uncharacterized protein n=1 Tax=Rhodopirellula islandica TaxID=595434 RepID=A0A0J1BMN3_RHOIS|nr:hypothetical protein RISK_000264 [Rhodopirellula islandica]
MTDTGGILSRTRHFRVGGIKLLTGKFNPTAIEQAIQPH